jgi:hypothetical protein
VAEHIPPAQRVTLTADEVEVIAGFLLACRDLLTPLVTTVAPMPITRPSKNRASPSTSNDITYTLIRRELAVFDGNRFREPMSDLLRGSEISFDPVELSGLRSDFARTAMLKLGSLARQLFAGRYGADREAIRLFGEGHHFATKVRELQLAILQGRDPNLSVDEQACIRRLFSAQAALPNLLP